MYNYYNTWSLLSLPVFRQWRRLVGAEEGIFTFSSIRHACLQPVEVLQELVGEQVALTNLTTKNAALIDLTTKDSSTPLGELNERRHLACALRQLAAGMCGPQIPTKVRVVVCWPQLLCHSTCPNHFSAVGILIIHTGN